ncbi:UDP-glucose 4-epimerase GalE [Thalassospira profundimaris]
MPFIEGDVRDTVYLEKSLKKHEVDSVIHLAGLKSVGESFSKPIKYYDNNVVGTVSLLKAMNGAQVRTMVFSSSATIYGVPKYLPLGEDHPTCAINPYGRSKLQTEEILFDLAVAGIQAEQLPWCIASLRYFNPVGAHSSGLIGENPNGIPTNLMPYVGRVASGVLPKLNIFGGDYDTQDGTGVRDYIHIVDLAEGHKAALGFLAKHSGAHAFNLGTGVGYSVLEVIEAYERASGQSVPYEIVSRRTGDVAACYANPSKANKELGWRALLTLEDMCASAWNFQSNQ